MAVVLIVEDEPTIRLLAESILQHAGYDTVSAGTLAEAQAVIHSEQPLDLIFTDLGLGDLTEAGVQVGHSAGQTRTGVPVLYTTGRPLTDGMQSLFVEPSAFLPKPYTDAALVAAVGELFKQP